MSVVSHIFICLFVALGSLFYWVICPHLVFSSGTPYDITAAVIVAQDKTPAIVVEYPNPKVFGSKYPLFSVTLVAERVTEEAHWECWWCHMVMHYGEVSAVEIQSGSLNTFRLITPIS